MNTQNNGTGTVAEPVVVGDSIWKFVGDELTSILPDDPEKAYHISDFPTVYICAAEEHTKPISFIAYVGETNNIKNRTSQHLNGDARIHKDWEEFRSRADKKPASVQQYVIGHEHFNKSLTLDIENRIMQFLSAVSSVETLNNRMNPQGNYYTQDEFDVIFSRAWSKLHKCNGALFPPEEEVRNSALFKASPFHRLSKEQLEAEHQILNAIIKANEAPNDELPLGAYGKLIVVQGAAGTGKTVLLSHLFNTLLAGETNKDNKLERNSNQPRAFLLISHEEQRNVYNQIAKKLGLQKKSDDVVLNPVSFLKKYSNTKISKSGQDTTTDYDSPSDRVDIALIDEAHLLPTQNGQAYQGKSKSILLDVARRAKVTIAVFDPEQILESSQRWDERDLKALLGDSSSADTGKFARAKLGEGETIDRMVVKLEVQFRIAANKDVTSWIDNFINGKGIGPLPQSDEYFLDGKLVKEPYELRVFDSPVELFSAIREKAVGSEAACGLSRVLATYDWSYSKSNKNPNDPQGLWNVEMHRDDDGNWMMDLAEGDSRGYIAGDKDPNRFCHPWNYGLSPHSSNGMGEDAWAEQEATLEEIGSTFTIQGFDLNYAGVIIGPSVKLRDGKLVFDGSASKNKKATNKRGGKIDYSAENLQNELNVLLKRGVHGLYLFAVDPELQAALKRASNGEVGFVAE